MTVGGLGDECSQPPVGLRQLSGISRILCRLLRPQAVPGAQPELSSSPAGAVRGAAQRRESPGAGGHLRPGDAAVPGRGPVGRCRSRWAVAGMPGPRAGAPEAAWVLEGGGFPLQGRKSSGVARQHCGRMGKAANCQAGMFLACVGRLGRALVDKRLYLPRTGPGTRSAARGQGCPRRKESTGRRPSWPWRCWGRRWIEGIWGPAGWPRTTPSVSRPLSGRDWQPWGSGTFWTFPATRRSGPWGRFGPQRNRGIGGLRKPGLREGQRRTMEQRAAGIPGEDWQEITVAQGSQGPRSYRFSFQRVRATGRGKRGEIH